jgi:hypothetical protein
MNTFKTRGKTAFNPKEIELSELNNFVDLVLTDCGEENLYFTHNGSYYFCKAF